jgi:glutamine synthetase
VATNESRLHAWAREHDLRFVRFAWVDSAGVLRAQAIGVRRLDELADDGLGVVTGVQAVNVVGSMAATGLGLGAVGQVWLVPDRASARVLPWEPAHGSVMTAFVERDGAPWRFCPRQALTRATAALRSAGLELQAAFEHEFMLLRRQRGALAHFESSSYASAHGLDHAGPVLDDIADALERQGIAVRAMLKEAGLSQFEVSTEHGDPLRAADRFVAVRETIGAIAARHGLVGTALPLVFPDEAGNGWHVHFSLWRDGENLTGKGDALGREARAFVAGVHHHLPALLALSTPTPNSFRRLRPGVWAGAFRAWGFDHKEVPLRVPRERHGAPTNVELKSSDATANPYLSLTGLIAAGLDGVEHGIELPAPIDRDPASLSDAERAARGIVPLPASLAEALDHFEADGALRAALGEDLARAYVAVKRSEHAALADLPLEEQVARTAEAY